jgi:hypothetical protein
MPPIDRSAARSDAGVALPVAVMQQRGGSWLDRAGCSPM